MPISDETIREELLTQIGAQKSVAPRDVAQALTSEGEDWRSLLPRIRTQAVHLHGEKLLIFIRKRKIVSPAGLKGVYRLGAPETEPGGAK